MTMIERTSDEEFTVTRVFHAPAAAVFDAYTNAELVKRWWAPASRSVAMVRCEADVRAGGEYRYLLGVGANDRFVFAGTYLEVNAPTSIAYTQLFEPMCGEPLSHEATVTVTFTEHDGETTLVAHERYPSKQALDDSLQLGVADRIRETFEQLDELLATVTA